MTSKVRIYKYSQTGLLALSLLISGCAAVSTHDGESGSDRAHYIGSDPRILVHDLSQVMQASITGVLMYMRTDKCLAIKDWPRKGQYVTPVWPKGVEPIVDHGKRGIRLANGSLLLEGDNFTASGGAMARDAKEFKGLLIPPSCSGGSDSLIVLNNDLVSGNTGEELGQAG